MEKSFRMDSDDKETLIDETQKTDLHEEEREDMRIEKLGQRVTIISVIIPFLLIAICAVFYLNIKGRINVIKNKEIKNISRNLESKFSALSLKQAKIEEFAQKIDSLKLSKMQKDIDQNEKEADRIYSRLKKEIDETNSLLKDVISSAAQLRREITELKAEKIDAKTLDEKIEEQQTVYRNMIKFMSTKYEENLKNIGNRLNKIEKDITSLKSKTASSKRSTYKRISESSIEEQDIKN